jgi:hypothetical protein
MPAAMVVFRSTDYATDAVLLTAPDDDSRRWSEVWTASDLGARHVQYPLAKNKSRL